MPSLTQSRVAGSGRGGAKCSLRSLFFVLLLLAMALPAQPKPIFRTYGTNRAPAFDPHLSNDPYQFRLFAQLYEPPLEMGVDERGACLVKAGLCELPEVTGGDCTYRLELRTGARFHPDPCFGLPDDAGRPLSPDDLAYLFLRHADPATPSPFWLPFLASRVRGLNEWRLAAETEGFADYSAKIPGLEVEENALLIHLTAPFPQFTALLTQPWASIVPREAVQRYGSGFAEHPVGSGPFRLDRVDALGTVRLVPHEHYRIPGRPRIADLRFEKITDVEQRAARFAKGALQTVPVWDGNRDTWLDAKGGLRPRWSHKGYRLATGPALSLSYVVFAMRDNSLRQRTLRKALSLAVDRSAYSQIVLGNPAFATKSPIPSGLPEAAAIAKLPGSSPRQDLDAARKLLNELGSEIPTLTLDVPGWQADTHYAKAIESLIRDWKRIGVTVQLRATKYPEFMARVKRNDFQMALLGWYADYPDCENFLTLLRSNEADPVGSCNYGRFKDADYDELHELFRKLPPGPARTNLVQRMVKRFWRESPWIVLAAPREQSVLGPGVGSFQLNLLNRSLRDVTFHTPSKR